MLKYYLLGVLELRFRGGELCRGRGDGEHDSILLKECVFMKILFRNHRETFFSLFLEARFAPCLGLLKFRVTKTQPNYYMLNLPPVGMLHCLYARLCVSFTFVCSRD